MGFPKKNRDSKRPREDEASSPSTRGSGSVKPKSNSKPPAAAMPGLEGITSIAQLRALAAAGKLGEGVAAPPSSDDDDDEDAIDLDDLDDEEEEDFEFGDEDEEEEDEEEEDGDGFDIGKNPWHIIMSLLQEANLKPKEQKALEEKLIPKAQLPEAVTSAIPLAHIQAMVLAYFDAQLLNGGFSQYIYNVNAEPLVLDFTLACLEHVVKAPKHAALLKKTVDLLKQMSDEKISEFVNGEYFGENSTRDRLDKYSKDSYKLRGGDEDGKEEEKDPEEDLTPLVMGLLDEAGLNSDVDEEEEGEGSDFSDDSDDDNEPTVVAKKQKK